MGGLGVIILTRDEIAEIAVSFFDPDDNTAAYSEAESVPGLIDTALAYHAAKRDSSIYAYALREAITIIDGLVDQQAMPDDWYVTQLTYLRVLAASDMVKDEETGSTDG